MTNLNIISENENALYKRKEIKATVKAEITPNNKEVKEMLAKQFSTQVESIVIKGIYGKFGSKEFEINANIYETAEDRKRNEPLSKKELEVEKQAKAAEEEAKKAAEVPVEEAAPAEKKPAEAPTEEAPKEEVKIEEESKPVEEEKKE